MSEQGLNWRIRAEAAEADLLEIKEKWIAAEAKRNRLALKNVEVVKDRDRFERERDRLAGRVAEVERERDERLALEESATVARKYTEATEALREWPTDAELDEIARVLHIMGCVKGCTSDPSGWRENAEIVVNILRPRLAALAGEDDG